MQPSRGQLPYRHRHRWQPNEEIKEEIGDVLWYCYSLAQIVNAGSFDILVHDTLVHRIADIKFGLTCAAPAYLAKHGRPAHPRELAEARHECIHYVVPVIGRRFPWEFHRGRQKIRVAVSGRLTVNNVGTMQMPPAKVRSFMDFVVRSAADS